jgi:hypothetical protein
MAYHFSMLRFVPDPARGEFVNIGAIAGDDDASDWAFRLIQNFRRAKAIDDNGRLGMALAFADKVEEHVAAVEQLPETGDEPVSLRLLESWVEEMRNVVQITPPTPLIADSAEAALDLVFSELVVDPAARRFRFEKKHRAVGSTRKAYRDHRVPDESIATRAPVSSGPYEGMFDFAVFNGQVVQLVNCWSFQLPNQLELAEEVKAWAWVVHELREHGGVLRVGGHELTVPAADEIEVVSVFIPPEDDQPAHAFEEARAAFGETRVRAVPVEQADEVGLSAAQRLSVTA